MKWNNLNVFTISSAMYMFAWGLIGPFYVVYIQKIGGSIENLGIAFGIFTIFQSLFSYIGGKYADKLGRKPLLIVTGYLISILYISYILISNITQLYILQAIFGIVNAIDITVASVFLADITHKNKRGKQMGMFRTIVGIVAGLAMLASGFIVGKFGFEIMFYIVALFTAIAATFLFWVKETLRKKK